MNVRLYLPEGIEDRKRGKKVGPAAAEYWAERTKHASALEVVEAALERKLRFRCVGREAFYGINELRLRVARSDRTLSACRDVKPPHKSGLN